MGPRVTAVACAIGLILLSPEAQSEVLYTQVDFSASANARLQDFPEPWAFTYTGGIYLPDGATGAQVLGGIPFFISPEGNSQGHNAWNAHIATGPNPRILEIAVDIEAPQTVFTLINTYFGVEGPDSLAYIEFLGLNGSYYRKDLIGGVDIRNYNEGGWTNTINGTTTTEVFSYNTLPNGIGQRLDMQRIELPTGFWGDRLTTIRLVDLGRNISQSAFAAGDRDFQRILLSGITVASVPEPSTLILSIAGFGIAGLACRGRLSPLMRQ